MKRKYIVISMALLSAVSTWAQEITGTVTDALGSPVAGAKVHLVNTPNISAITDRNGVFVLNGEEGDWMVVSYADAIGKRIRATGKSIQIKLDPQDRIVNMGMANRTTDRQTQAISIVTAEELEKNATPNSFNALYGLVPGLEVMQRTGWTQNPTTLLRGSDNPLIVVDGFPRPIECLNTVEIESVTVLKDGPATALWGARGANGVILVTTKRGQYNTKMQVNVNYKYGMDFPINQPEFANGYEYAAALNEALYYDGLEMQYTRNELDAFKNGSNRDLYANSDWLGEGLRKHTVNNQLDINFRGGGKNLRYYTMLSYKNDYGILNDKYAKYSDRYSAQMRKYELDLRMNIDIDITPSTLAQLTMLGSLRERKRPATYEGNLFQGLFNTPSGAFPVKTSNGIWGSNSVLKDNPLARIADIGYFKENPRMLQADMRIRQDLSSLTPGLSAEVAVAYDNNAVFKEQGSKNFQYAVNTPVVNVVTGEKEAMSEVYGDNSALTVSCWGMTEQYINASLEAQVKYDRMFGKHGVSATALYRQESERALGANNAYKRMYITGMARYNYNNTYLLDVVFNQYGTSVLPEGDKFRSYPAVSAAWVLSNESFMKKMTAVNLLKIRASYGRAGWDQIPYGLTQQYYIWGGQYYFGDANNVASGNKEDKLAMNNLTLEVSDKYNVGIDMRLFNKLSVTLDAFLDKRSNILIGANNLISSAIGISVPQQNAGKEEKKGLEVSMEWKDYSRKDFHYYVGANLTYIKTKVVENGEGYKPWSYLSGKGLAIGQIFGLEAIGYFRDEADIANSPKQQFSEVRPGDVKYKDMNNDGIIDDNDKHAIGYSSSIPEIYCGIRLGFEYKGFGVDALFQGATRFSKMLNTSSVYWPLRNNTNISNWYLHDKIRWTEETKDIANVPRLSTLNNANNFQNSTQWLVNGEYLKLRNLNVYYDLPKNWISKIKLEQCRIFASANNVFSLDHVKYMNCEDFSVNYPDMFSVYFGASIKF